MALNTRGGGGNSSTTYLNIYQGNIVLEYDKQEDLESKLEGLGLDAEAIKVRQRVKGKNEGKDVFYYVLYDVAGTLSGIRLNDTDFGEFMEVEFTDVDEKIVISLGDVSSRMAKDFVRRVGNLDLNKEVVFGVWSISAEEADNGKAKSGVRMYQDDKKIEYFIGYDEMPEPTQKSKGRKTVWDFSDQEAYLYDELVAFVEGNFKGSVDTPSAPAPTPSAPANKTRKKADTVKSDDADDDLPF